jgi:hypothetical protein
VKRGKPKRAVNLGRKGYRVEPGRRAKVRIRVRRGGLRLLKRLRKMKVTARATPGITGQAPASGRFTLKPARK